MSYQEALWNGKYVWITGILSKSGRAHMFLRGYVGQRGMIIGEAKNGMLLVRFSKHTRAIPAGCVAEYGTVKTAR